jgi:16S rRNA (uracil1498-N3)-methyltransferase
MSRYFITPAEFDRDDIRLGAEDSHHLLHVLRSAIGAPVTVLDGTGREARCRLVRVDSGAAALAVIERAARPRPPLHLTLVQAMPKLPRMDLIIEKATELGVSCVRPVVSERSVVRLASERSAARRNRWLKIAAGAAKQCQTPWIPELAEVVSLDEFIAAPGPFDLLILASLEPDAKPLRAALATAAGRKLSNVGLVIGPEGDLTPAEYAGLRSIGAVPVTLGPLVLRVETAAIAALAVLAYELAQP